MPGKRTTTPLFDLLQQGRRAGVETSLPPEPRPADQPEKAPARAEGRAQGTGLAEAPIRIVGDVVQIPLLYGALALTLAIIAVFGAWSLGYQRGERKAKSDQRLLETALGPGSRIVEPGASGATGPNGAGVTASPNKDQTTGPAVSPGPMNFLTAAGPTDADPRLANHNYLHLGAQLRAEQVQAALAFLRERGIDGFGVIDPGTRRRNDGPLFVLIAGLGFPSGEADSPEAQRYRKQVLAAGAAWKQAGGVKNFDDAYWKLFKP